jgi:hypothetical protein
MRDRTRFNTLPVAVHSGAGILRIHPCAAISAPFVRRSTVGTLHVRIGMCVAVCRVLVRLFALADDECEFDLCMILLACCRFC